MRWIPVGMQAPTSGKAREAGPDWDRIGGGVRVPAAVSGHDPGAGATVGRQSGFREWRLRYVILDFSLSRLPGIEQRFHVYREGQKVGEVKISGPSQNMNIAADIVAGEAKIGDDVRQC